ncbi:MAG: hypothetical protein OHK93_004537 [Ramalina farinacea]|uniref:Stc1 domain-containing protein n=1 Tax=Ramalina farinacea TaxID=258253 RepID=A0AA43QYR5_9LECA|nr:hypothetical protein [Ramalina farinacea]
MPKGGFSIHKGGYNALNAEKLANVELPLKTRCSACERLKAISSFSNKETNKLRSSLATGRIRSIDEAKGMHIKCKECNTGQVTEIEVQKCLQCVMEINMTPEIPANEIEMALMARNIDPKDSAYDDDPLDDESSAPTNPYASTSAFSHADSDEYESTIGSSRNNRKKFSKFGKPAGTKNKPLPVYDNYDGGRKVDYDDEDDEEGSDRGEW